MSDRKAATDIKHRNPILNALFPQEDLMSLIRWLQLAPGETQVSWQRYRSVKHLKESVSAEAISFERNDHTQVLLFQLESIYTVFKWNQS